MTATMAPPAGTHGHEHAHAILREARAWVEPTMRGLVGRLDGDLARICGHHLGWSEPDRTPPGDREDGTALRPALTQVAAGLVGTEDSVAVECACAVQLLHHAALLHDDVIDRDRIRRGVSSGQSQSNVSAGVLAGDALMGLALAAVAGADRSCGRGLFVLAETITAVHNGRQQELNLATRPVTGQDTVTLDECLAMAGNKTGALLGAALALPAACLPAVATTTVNALYLAGRHLGIAIHCVDDIRRLWGDPRTASTPAHTDPRSAGKSIPIVLALRGTCSDAVADALKELSEVDTVADRRWSRMTARLAESGCRDATMAIATREADRSLRYLRTAGRESTVAEALVGYVLGRAS
ncbi:polyprenyl synthetase family protein [Amycolatopsis sp. NPDC059021]|uniref:polyprenyl synthetase family protein n=1 Tax=Amycolatopsis sp. NPDC059021 TaxID=3346704 RepID=UPI00366E79A5